MRGPAGEGGATLSDEWEGSDVLRMVTEGGLKQGWKKMREERRVKGTGMGRVIRWNRKAHINYVHCRTGKGNLQAWRNVIDDTVDPKCRKCGMWRQAGTQPWYLPDNGQRSPAAVAEGDRKGGRPELYLWQVGPSKCGPSIYMSAGGRRLGGGGRSWEQASKDEEWCAAVARFVQ